MSSRRQDPHAKGDDPTARPAARRRLLVISFLLVIWIAFLIWQALE